MSSTTSPGWASPFSTCSTTLRPTIMLASPARSVCAGVVVPTSLPPRSTEMVSHTAIASRSLWVMKMIADPAAARSRITLSSSSVSVGVSTAVGSSRMRMSACRYSALRISTRCCVPTARSSTRAVGSTASPYWLESSRIRADAAAASRNGPLCVSAPSMMFSATVNTGTSWKCWWTMPTPRSMASPGLRRCTGSPLIRISPSSGW